MNLSPSEEIIGSTYLIHDLIPALTPSINLLPKKINDKQFAFTGMKQRHIYDFTLRSLGLIGYDFCWSLPLRILWR